MRPKLMALAAPLLGADRFGLEPENLRSGGAMHILSGLKGLPQQRITRKMSHDPQLDL